LPTFPRLGEVETILLTVGKHFDWMGILATVWMASADQSIDS